MNPSEYENTASRLPEGEDTATMIYDGFNIPGGEYYLQSDRLLTAKDLQYIFSIGKNRAYELMNSKAFPTLRLGSRKYVSRSALQKWVETYSGREYLL